MPEKESKDESKVKYAKAELTAVGVVTAEAEVRVVISWDEVNRLLDNKEYSAAILVAAVNIEYVLTRFVLRCKKSIYTNPFPKNTRLSSEYGKQPKHIREQTTLGTLCRMAKFLCDNCDANLQKPWEKQVEPIVKHRNRIAHEHAYFKRLRELKIISEEEIRQMIDNARNFCHDNPQ